MHSRIRLSIKILVLSLSSVLMLLVKVVVFTKLDAGVVLGL